jgi:hypothetical protein
MPFLLAEQQFYSIIFIHGLTGNRHDTWTKNVGKRNECFWPQDLLAEDIPNARIATWGYDADIVHGLPFHAVSTNTLQQHSGNLCGHLANLRSASEHRHPIIFIVHSLGGLVCKSVIMSAVSSGVVTDTVLCRLSYVPPRRGPVGKSILEISRSARGASSSWGRHIKGPPQPRGPIC